MLNGLHVTNFMPEAQGGIGEAVEKFQIGLAGTNERWTPGVWSVLSRCQGFGYMITFIRTTAR